MKKFIKDFPFYLLVMLILSFPVIAIGGIAYCLYGIGQEKKEMSSYIGKRIVVEKDTLLITDKSWWSKTFQLSNNTDIDYELGKKLIISDKKDKK